MLIWSTETLLARTCSAIPRAQAGWAFIRIPETPALMWISCKCQKVVAIPLQRPTTVPQAAGQLAASLLDQTLAHGMVAGQHLYAAVAPGVLPGQCGDGRMQLRAGR